MKTTHRSCARCLGLTDVQLRLARALLAAVEREQFRQRSGPTRAGLAKRRRAGLPIARQPGFGFRYQVLDGAEGVRVVPDEREREAIALAKELHARGGYSLRRSSRELAAAGYFSRVGKPLTPKGVKAMIGASFRAAA